MPIIAAIPHHMIKQMPHHGEPCTRCGVCCFAALCDLAKAIHGNRAGPCPELQWHDGLSRCGLIERSDGDKREAAKLLINSGAGCDLVMAGEQRNLRYDAQRATFDRKNSKQLDAARKLWRMK